MARGGCWTAFARCFGSGWKDDKAKYNSSTTETIQFESLDSAEKRASHTSRQMVTEREREHIRSGNLDKLVDEQKRIDDEKAALLRRQEEALRLEEEAYYAAKREAASRRTRQAPNQQDPPLGPSVITDRTVVSVLSTPPPSSSSPPSLPSLPPSSSSPRPHPPRPGPGAGGGGVRRVVDTTDLPSWLTNELNGEEEEDEYGDSGGKELEEEDFDKFLESVRARQLSVPGSAVAKAPGDGGGDDVDFGYWEKAAPLPTHTQTHTHTHTHTHTSKPIHSLHSLPPSTRTQRDNDLSLL